MAIKVRTCCVCKKKGQKENLFRFVLEEDGINIDLEQKSAGRGVYVHANAQCLLHKEVLVYLKASLEKKLTKKAFKKFKSSNEKNKTSELTQVLEKALVGQKTKKAQAQEEKLAELLKELGELKNNKKQIRL